MISLIRSISTSKGLNGGIRMHLAIFLHSLSVIGFQIILMRILSLNQWDHLANMIITIAMLGFGVSGTLLSITGRKLQDMSSWLIPFLMVMSALFMLVAFRLSQIDFIRFDTLLVFISGKQMMRLVIFILMFFMTFFTASLAIGLVFVKNVSGIGKLYFANLIGSGLGGAIALLLLVLFYPQNALVLLSVFPCFAALLILPHRKRAFTILPIVAVSLMVALNLTHPVQLAFSQYKSIARVLQLPDAKVAIELSGVSSMVHVVESDHIRFAPGLSLNYTGKVPVKPMAFVNGDAAGFITDDTLNSGTDILAVSGYQLPFLLTEARSTAVIRSGTGTWVAQALRNGAEKVYAFETRVTLLAALNKWHNKNYPSVYEDQRVSLFKTEARAFFNSTDTMFDLIMFPSVGSFGGSSGLNAVAEDYTLTVEALQACWDRLDDSGVIAVTVYNDYPPRALLKLTALLTKVLKNNSVADPANHIAAVRSWTSISFAVSKSPFSDQQISGVRSFADEMGFDLFILPGITSEERNYYHYIENKELFNIVDELLAGKPAGHFRDYLFCIEPPTDDKPYFSRYVRVGRIKALLDQYKWEELPFVELGYIVVWLTLIIALLLSLVFILLPLVRFSRSRGSLPVLLYFGSIGLGFMFAEIILIQRFVLYLGQPVYAVSAVLSIMLIASGIGSYFSSRVRPGFSRHKLLFAVIFLVIAAYALFLTPFLRYSAGVALPVKVIITCCIVTIPAFLMGMPFPLGLRAVGVLHSDKVAWAWGINGFLSVVSAPLALILAVEIGSSFVAGAAAFAYLLAMTALLSLKFHKT